MILLGKETTAQILGDAGLTTAIGLIVVFAVLLLLVVVFKVFGMIMSKVEKGEQAAPPQVAAPVVASAPAIVGNTAPVSGQIEIQNGIADETVAAIAGAVACMAPAGTQYAVRKIVKK